jgi:hypothetical protein
MIRTLTRVKRIPMLALFFVSSMDFILERAGTDLVFTMGALTILLCGELSPFREEANTRRYR